MRRQAWLLVGGAGLVLLLLLGLLLSAVEQRHQMYRDLIHQHEQRIARLQGLRDAGAELAAAADRAETEILAIARDPGRPEQADLNLLRTVQGILRDVGVAVHRSQEQPRREHSGFTTERLAFQGAGTMPQLLQALEQLQQHRPSIRIESLRITPDDVRAEPTAEQRVQIFLDVAVAELQP
ncbi:hypothetical protein THITH_10170 [Thioalkalivibrio paradoxus ARh 1]|uniref:General secretion pathway protein M n=2 Tax=Thioalkalivibrio paradoxus TaxID=108010 RepID=W0DS90_9GAMM|nr:hypothetical protein THITH_10170 [Thioalkalivibrio paradoxus ARh 1]